MLLLALGLIFLVMKTLQVGPGADWSWWFVLAPFALAVVWWTWADRTGYTKRKAMERENARKQARINKLRGDIGTISTKRRK